MTSAPFNPASEPTRRTVVAAAGAVGLAVALTACGGSDDGSSASSSAAPEETGAGGSGGSGSRSGGGDNTGAGTALTKTADIPEGGGKVFSEEKVVVAQPAAGDFKAFSTICTHAGCPLIDLQGDTLSCNCHGSRFSVLDGSVKKGPATKPLAARQISVQGDSITLA
ncbi:Rieske (2Fe-2S) protein [Streptomyces sp. TRM68367]|uniref:Rieske (2Fe-2S) protein n=1 Tax=Streptomyces sp. TRM68367 TaxID=2758415 RepID=UPI00165B6E48|nr:Rieske (2Fe-2S) protein [Streptomyces sp. TRM68367]MBC9729628.1 Rieske (2Fe-2S) protein [Streptomyces sp. TRM68367]